MLVTSGNTPAIFAAAMVLSGIVYSAPNAIWPSFYAEMFDARVRYSGTAIGTQLGFLAAGFTPLVSASPGLAKGRTAGSPLAIFVGRLLRRSRPGIRESTARETSRSTSPISASGARELKISEDIESHADQRSSDLRSGRSWGRAGRLHAFKGVPVRNCASVLPRATPPPAWTEPRRLHGLRSPTRRSPAISIRRRGSGLSLNIWTPEADHPLPVQFFIHGGAFVTGGGADYDGSFLAAHGPAVIVTINYRLGPLGFLQLHRYGLSEANNLAISGFARGARLVRDNIANFGGDPDADYVVGRIGRRLHWRSRSRPCRMPKGKFVRALALSAPGATS